MVASETFTMDYADSIESTKVNIPKQQELFIGGKWVKPKSGKYFKTVDPATEKVLGLVAEADEKDVASAVRAARKAYDTVWGQMPGKERAKYLTALPASFKNGLVSLLCLRPWTAANPFESLETSTCLRRAPTSFTTPAGRTSLSTLSRALLLSPSA